ncbi:MAG TPA: hypothetical protein VF678_01570, partial [bacterium]
MSGRTMRRASAGATVLAGVAALALGGCMQMAMWTAPDKQPVATRTELAARADALFWKTLHDGNYDGIGQALTA